MKLNVVPASRGIQWVKLGAQTFFRQPLALSGLFFIFMAAITVVSLVPYIGSLLALALLPGANLGLLAATREASSGKFPMPVVLISAFRVGRQQMRAMLVLGLLYAVGVMFVLACSSMVDGGQFAKLYLFGTEMAPEAVQSADFKMAALLAAAMYLPLSLAFWHAPALVHWHGVPPLKSLFFSLVACVRNFGALTVYGLVWMGVFLSFGIMLAILGSLLGSAEAIAPAMYPAVLLLAAMVFTSVYFTFLDSFSITPGAAT